ncbi:MAG: CCA tRNA nucleotidyltransferase [Patescibacteria group bacterium]|nr:CCA tRNA nucleotidyltransferase [Patescibacteria group bacterium]
MKIPDYVKNIIAKLEQAGYEAYIVGGCVRDLLMNKQPKDWDVTTNAKPEKILRIFPDGRYENIFGTVIIPIKNKQGETEDAVEITTYRSEQGYSDRRHPDEIRFEDSLDKDLARRDFTINALAMKSNDSLISIPERFSNFQFPISSFQIIDLFGGQKDIKKKIIRAVGEPVDRFKEDALRMMRAVRLACELNFTIEPKTERAIKKMAGGIKFIANERVKDELVKILQSNRAYDGIMRLYNLKLLQYIIPELERGIGVSQCKHHIYSVFKHSVLSLKHCPNKDWRVRFAALMHDIAKPQTKKYIGGDATFYNHDIVGAKIAKKIMRRLKFSTADIEKVAILIRNHMFYYNVNEVTASSVRRLIKKVGEENLKDLIDLRIADRLGSGVPKAKPYKLRHLEYMMKKVRKDPLSVKMLKINGDNLMELLKIKPSVKIGAILDVLLSEAIEEPKLNNKKYLEKRSCELNELDLKELQVKAREKIDERKMEDDKELKKEFWVK